MEDLEVYSRASAVHIQDHGICYYCGCEAEHEYDDYAPPKDDAPFYIRTGEGCSLAIIPCCKECHGFLLRCRDGLIEERKLFVNKAIDRKYVKALRIYERWNEQELDELSHSLAMSVRAGIKLGQEASQRQRYPGFEYEIEGTVFHSRRKNIRIYTVFGEEFDNFRNALQYASRAYKININMLKELLMDRDANFDETINAYFAKIEFEKMEKIKNSLCDNFSKKYKQNVNFVKGALNAYMEVNPLLTMEECLILIYNDRVKKPEVKFLHEVTQQSAENNVPDRINKDTFSKDSNCSESDSRITR
jgi:hypothetical protein